jgi:Tfp pilus assembly protein PilZ
MMEQREFTRAVLNVTVNKSLLTSAPVSNVSESGMCINTDKFFSTGDMLVLDFTLPGNIEIKAFGKVRWHKQEPDGVHVNGLEFWHLEEEDRLKLRDFVKEWSKSGVRAPL